MAQIDIRHATIRIKDGYVGVGAGAVNHGGGYAASASVVLVDGFVGAIVTGDLVKFAGHNTLYAISAHSETLGNTSSITVTPALTDAIADDEVVTVQPKQLEVTIGDGNLTYDEKRTIKYIRDRGNLDTVREDQDEPMDVSIDATWEFLRAVSGDPPTIEDALKNRGEASDWISSSADLCEPYAVDLEVEYEPPCAGEDREIITLTDFRWESFSHDLKQGTLAVKGKCNVKEASVSRAA